ncbi:MAG: Fe-S cluster assembly protein SufD, partial [Actinomycetes bacterium]
MGVTHKVPGGQPGDVRPVGVDSFDLADHPVPSGREEEWRFTPLRRLRGLHDGSGGAAGAAVGMVVVAVDAAPEVTVETVERNDPRLGTTGTPVDRVAAQAWQAFERATVVTVPAGVVASRPTVVSRRGDGAGGAAVGPVLIDAGTQAEAVVVVGHLGA